MFIRAQKTYSGVRTKNCLQVAIEHLTGIKLPAEGVEQKDYSAYMKTTTSDYFRLTELKLFSGRSIRSMRMTALKIQKKQLKKGSLSITTRKLKKMKGHRIFDRGSGLLLIRCSTDISRRKRHIFIVNLTSQYIYDGGRQFLSGNGFWILMSVGFCCWKSLE